MKPSPQESGPFPLMPNGETNLTQVCSSSLLSVHHIPLYNQSYKEMLFKNFVETVK